MAVSKKQALLPLIPSQQRTFLANIRRGASIAQAASVYGYTDQQVRALFKKDLDFRRRYEKAASEPRIKLIGKGYDVAMKGNVAMLQFMIRHFCGFPDPEVEDVSPKGTPSVNINIHANATVEKASDQYERLRTKTIEVDDGS